MSALRCPECGEPVRHAPIQRPTGWMLDVDVARLEHLHEDGTPLCPVMTDRGYQPALPELDVFKTAAGDLVCGTCREARHRGAEPFGVRRDLTHFACGECGQVLL